MAAARALLEVAEHALEEAGDAEDRKKAKSRVAYARGKLAKLTTAAPGEKAPRTERWSIAKLTAIEKAGDVGDPEQASVICAAYGLSGSIRDRVTELAAQARVTRATITLGADGLWWCSVGAEVPHMTRTAADPETGEKIPEPTPRQAGAGKCGSRSWQPRHAPEPGAAPVIGVDFGVREIATASNGTCIPNPRYLEDALAELRAAQKRLSRCQPGSKRREKAARRAGLIHADVARLRDASLQRATTALVRGHAVIAVEGWDVQQVLAEGSKDVPRKLRRQRNRALADTGIGMGRQMIVYKGPRAGTRVLVTGPQAKTGRTCSVDGRARTTPLPPGEEMFRSDQCGHVLPRRENTARALAGWAAQEIKRGLPHSSPDKPRGGDVRPAAVRRDGQSPVKRAASTGRPAQTGIPGG
jgi:putative transposase